MYKIKSVLLFMGFINAAIAQNNAIFTGGAGDGQNNISFLQASGNIFNGATGDGWNVASFQQSASNIFIGGQADGWSNSAFLQSSPNFFTGGTGDGWEKSSFLQTGNDIFNGGEGDGWNFTNFGQPSTNIFNGGEGDGWSFTYLPMGPLPVSFTDFTASKWLEIASRLQWKTSQEINSARFEVERSEDAIHYIKIGSVEAAGNSSILTSYNFTDYQPAPGLNYYRLKQVDRDGRYEYTPSRLVRFDRIKTATITCYPNPTSGILNIQIPENNRQEALLINISHTGGVVVVQYKISANGQTVRTVDLSRLPKGTYFIQVKGDQLNIVERIIVL